MQTLRISVILTLLIALLISTMPTALADSGPAGDSGPAIVSSATDNGINFTNASGNLLDPLAPVSKGQDSIDAQAMIEYVAVESSRSIPDNGIGFSLMLPAGSTASYPAELQAITVVQVFAPRASLESGSSLPIKVEIAAERVLDTVSQDQWRQMREYFATAFGEQVVASRAVEVMGRPAVFREISAGESVLWETEVWVGHAAYIIAGVFSPQMEKLYQQVLSGLHFTGADTLPVNDLPPVDALEQVSTPAANTDYAPEAQPNLMFPFNGTKTITCAYNADDPNCHALAKIALDFSLDYEAVRAAHSGSLTRPSYDTNYGNWIRLTDRSDPSYVTVYAHLASFMGSTGNVNQGDYIARSGNTGRSDGPHLHFELRRNEIKVKPEPMCSQTGFRRYQTKTDCWPATEAFASGATSQISITTQSVNLRVCASNLPGRTVYVSLWRNAAAGYPARGWLVSQVASSTCVQFNDLDGAGNTFAGVTYYTNAALRAIPADLASQQKTGCYSATGRKLMCDTARR